MFAPPQLIETEVFAAVPQNLRKSHVPAERIAAGAGGVPAGSFLEGPSFDRAGNLYVVDIPYGRIFRISPQGKQRYLDYLAVLEQVVRDAASAAKGAGAASLRKLKPAGA